MAEIRINAPGGVKLYDADDSHYAQIVAGTITSNVDAITLGHDTVTIADNLSLGSDSAVLKFGADGDTTLTHTDGTGLTLNSTNKLCFNDASQYIQGASNAILDIATTDEIELTATLVDLNGNLDVSGTYTGAGLMTTGGNIVIPNAGNIGSASDTDAIAIASNGVVTFSQNPVFPDGGVAVADLDIDGATDIGADLVDADEIIVDDGGGGTNRRCDMSRLKTYIGGGITEADQWRLTTDYTGTATITANLERVDSKAFNYLGTGMSHSSGIFTFPSTGYWYLEMYSSFMYNNGTSTYAMNHIVTTDDNSSYTEVTSGSTVISAGLSGTHTQSSSSYIVDVTNTTNVKVKFGTQVQNTDVITNGSTSENVTYMTFIRLGDT